MDTPTARFRDPRSTVYDFLDLVLEHCPGCAGAARVVRVPGDEGPGGRRPFATRRLVCGGCGASRKCDGTRLTFPRGAAGPVTDPYFGRPLWLRAETRHGTLWAYNLDPVDLLASFEAVSVLFVVEVRRAISIPADLRSGHAARMHPELAARSAVSDVLS